MRHRYAILPGFFGSLPLRGTPAVPAAVWFARVLRLPSPRFFTQTLAATTTAVLPAGLLVGKEKLYTAAVQARLPFTTHRLCPAHQLYPLPRCVYATTFLPTVGILTSSTATCWFHLNTRSPTAAVLRFGSTVAFCIPPHCSARSTLPFIAVTATARYRLLVLAPPVRAFPLPRSGLQFYHSRTRCPPRLPHARSPPLLLHVLCMPHHHAHFNLLPWLTLPTWAARKLYFGC